MGEFRVRRIDDMLRIYGDKIVAAEEAEAQKCGERLDPYMRDYYRHLGECRAWAVHDSFFIWERPLSNTFEELRDHAVAEAPAHVCRQVTDWCKLKEHTLTTATNFLARMTPPAFPELLPEEHKTKWWIWMAIIHQCEIELRYII